MFAINVESLSKRYSDDWVIKDLSFEIERGEIFALLGVNGAGKTTILECIEGLRSYETGHIAINGTIGVQLQSSTLPPHITVTEAITLFSKWRKSPPDIHDTASLDLSSFRKKQYASLSVGQKRKLHLALSLIGDPDILFLDEPTAGIDVEGRIALHREIRKLRDSGKTIVMASHDMAEVESLCDRIAILREGHFAFMGAANDLTTELQQDKKIFIKANVDLHQLPCQHCRYIANFQDYQVFQTSHLSDALLELLDRAQKAHALVLDVRIEHASLEQRFIDVSRDTH